MNYILKNITYNGAPKVSQDNAMLIQNVTILTGIENDTYEFTRVDEYETSSPMTMTAEEIKQNIITQCVARVQELYPNT